MLYNFYKLNVRKFKFRKLPGVGEAGNTHLKCSQQSAEENMCKREVSSFLVVEGTGQV
jgi:hypothetical protein